MTAQALPHIPADWHALAACRDTMGGLDDEIFTLSRQTAKGFIRDFCHRCPVVLPCGVAGQRERHGVWGGVWRG